MTTTVLLAAELRLPPLLAVAAAVLAELRLHPVLAELRLHPVLAELRLHPVLAELRLHPVLAVTARARAAAIPAQVAIQGQAAAARARAVAAASPAWVATQERAATPATAALRPGGLGETAAALQVHVQAMGNRCLKENAGQTVQECTPRG